MYEYTNSRTQYFSVFSFYVVSYAMCCSAVSQSESDFVIRTQIVWKEVDVHTYLVVDWSVRYGLQRNLVSPNFRETSVKRISLFRKFCVSRNSHFIKRSEMKRNVCLFSSTIWCLPTSMMSVFLFAFFLDVLRLLNYVMSACLYDICSIMWCLPSFTMFAQLYEVSSTVWCLSSIIVSADLYYMPNCRMSAQCTMSIFLYPVFLPVWCVPTCMMSA